MPPKPCRVFAEDVRHTLGKIISENYLVGMSLALRMEDFREVISEDPESVEFFLSADPYIYVFIRFMMDCIVLIDRDDPRLSGYPIAFVLDSHSQWKKAEEAYNALLKNPSFGPRIATISHADDKQVIPFKWQIYGPTKRVYLLSMTKQAEIRDLSF
jgi:hypothetical protein